MHWTVIDFEGRANLDDPAAVHHGDPLSDGQRFSLVVGDVDHGRSNRPVQLEQLRAE